MYDREEALNGIRKLEMEDALAKNTKEVTSNTTKNIAIKMLMEKLNINFTSKITG